MRRIMRAEEIAIATPLRPLSSPGESSSDADNKESERGVSAPFRPLQPAPEDPEHQAQKKSGPSSTQEPRTNGSKMPRSRTRAQVTLGACVACRKRKSKVRTTLSYGASLTSQVRWFASNLFVLCSERH